MTGFGQDGYDLRVEWGPRGAHELVASGATTVVVVDVLSFTTTLAVAVARGSLVRPFRFDQTSARAEADRLGAVCAVGRSVAGPGEISLSPASVLAAEPPATPRPPLAERVRHQRRAGGVGCAGRGRSAAQRVGGRGLARDPAGPGGCRRRRGAVVRDDSLRPAVEGLWGAGAVVDALVTARSSTSPSPEATVARAVWLAVRTDAAGALRACASGVELGEKGFGVDVEVAAEVDATDVVTVLIDGWFTSAPAG